MNSPQSGVCFKQWGARVFSNRLTVALFSEWWYVHCKIVNKLSSVKCIVT